MTQTMCWFALVAAVAALSGCGGDDDSDTGSPAPASTSIEIEGTWSSDFMSTEVIDDTSWAVDFGDGPSVSVIAWFSNDDDTAVTQNPDDAAFDPGKFNRIVWTPIVDGSFHYCTVDFGLHSVEDAQASDTEFDASDPDTSGCGGFSWTKLSRP